MLEVWSSAHINKKVLRVPLTMGSWINLPTDVWVADEIDLCVVLDDGMVTGEDRVVHENVSNAFEITKIHL